MNGRSDLKDIQVQMRRETAKAWGIADPNGSRDLIWLPKSQCELEPGEGPNKMSTLTAPEWLLKERGLI